MATEFPSQHFPSKRTIDTKLFSSSRLAPGRRFFFIILETNIASVFFFVFSGEGTKLPSTFDRTLTKRR